MFVLILTIFMSNGDAQSHEVGYFTREYACNVSGRAIVQDVAATSKGAQGLYECVFVETGEAA